MPLAPHPGRGMWVVLRVWSDGRATAPPPEWALTHRDGVTGLWTVYGEALPDGHPTAALWRPTAEASARSHHIARYGRHGTDARTTRLGIAAVCRNGRVGYSG